MSRIALAIHGGAGTLVKGMMTAEKEAAYKSVLQEALNSGYALLVENKSALDAVEAAVKKMEDSHLFNAGKGSVFTADETHEMDASILDGKTLDAGAVSLISGIKNPISLARDVMENSGHVFLAGEGAEQFAKSQGYEKLPPSYFYDELRHSQWLDIKDSDDFQLDHAKKDSKFGTVGAVACDSSGNIAAATSTGGMTNKRYGRVGDSPLIGAGNYANNKTCAVSCTGSGEFFIRGVVAYDVSALMEHKGMSLMDAANEVIYRRITEINGDGGLVSIDSKGNIAMPFNTEGMYRAAKYVDGSEEILIYK
jgi:beta-aspartyl-peptidase (threonine type)